jgi:uncharacterized coiled-coil DUF342 family protein
MTNDLNTEILQKSNSLHQMIEENIDIIIKKLNQFISQEEKKRKTREIFKNLESNIDLFLNEIKKLSKDKLDISAKLQNTDRELNELKTCMRGFSQSSENFDYEKKLLKNKLFAVLINIRELNSKLTKLFL